MSVESPDGAASHALAPVLGRVVVVDHNRMTDDGGLAAEWEVGVGEELLGGAQIQDLPRHIQQSQLGGEVSDPAPERSLVSLAVLVNPETEKNEKNSYESQKYLRS